MTMVPNQTDISNLDLWKAAFGFHMRYRAELGPLLPLLFIPIWTDCYHSVLIRQAIVARGVIEPVRAIAEAMKLFPSFAATKLRLYLVASLWSFLPIIGWYKDFRFRLKWAMVSNVKVFESGKKGSVPGRLETLANLIIEKKRTNALLVIPVLFQTGLLIVITIGITTFASSVFLWVGLIGVAWIALPASAIVNTLLYLSITGNPGLAAVLRSTPDR